MDNKKIKIDSKNPVVNNFFNYLKLMGKKQKEYAKENMIDESTLSKWKKGETSPSVDQIKQAAKYFGITVNDLVYDEKEKKNLEVLADKSYDPILAQQSVKVKLYGHFFNKPLKVLLFCFLAFSVLMLMVYVLRSSSPYFSSLILLGIPLSMRAIYINSFDEKTFIINYLDDIYYRRIESLNRLYSLSMVLRILSLLSTFYYITLYKDFGLATDVQRGLLITLMVLIMVLMFGSIIAITELPKKFKLEIYDNEITGYNSSKFSLIIHFSIFSVAVMFAMYDFNYYMTFLTVSFVFLVLNSLDFVNISLEYAKYTLMYQENNKNPRELFPKKN